MDERNKIRFVVLLLITLLYSVLMTSCVSKGNAVKVDTSDLEEQTETARGISDRNSEHAPSDGGKSVSAIIQEEWQASPHAATFVLDAAGNNNKCAQCHAPIEWMPSMDDLPESCYSCKFELDDPPPLILEEDWQNIPCKICHELNKDKSVQSEYAWLEIAPIDEYADVDTPSELCQKCHTQNAYPGHFQIQVAGTHLDYECTQCHNAHSTTASCGSTDCHPDTNMVDAKVPGHDPDHQEVACAVCHDGSGLNVGPHQATNAWSTFVLRAEDQELVPFVSHEIILEVYCDRCHFVDNLWGLSEQVDQP